MQNSFTEKTLYGKWKQNGKQQQRKKAKNFLSK